MVELLAKWLNEEVGLSRVSHTWIDIICLLSSESFDFGNSGSCDREVRILTLEFRKLPTSRTTLRAVTFWVNSFTNSTNNRTSKLFQLSMKAPI